MVYFAIPYTPYFVDLRLGGVGYGGVLKEEGGREAESGRANVQSLEHCRHCHLCCHQCHICYLCFHLISYYQNGGHHPLLGFLDHRWSGGR